MSFDSRSYVTTSDTRRIIQAAIFAADEVLIPTSVELDPNLEEDEQKFVSLRLHQLREISAVRFWEVEGQHTRMKLDSATPVQADSTIDRESYRDLMESVDQRLVEASSIFRPARSSSYDGITEMVHGKQAIWRFAVAQKLQANRVLLERQTQRGLTRFVSDLMRYEEFEAKVIERISSRLDLPDVSQLDIDDIVKCRSFMPAFRSKLLERTRDSYDEVFLTRMVDQVADAIVNEFLDVIQSLAPNVVLIGGKRIAIPKDPADARSRKWDLMQLMLAPLIASKYARYFFKWTDEAESRAPLLLLMQLRTARSS